MALKWRGGNIESVDVNIIHRTIARTVKNLPLIPVLVQKSGAKHFDQYPLLSA